MKYSVISAILALAASASAMPDQIEKRATCTNRFGFPYFCLSPTTAAPTQEQPQPTQTGGSGGGNTGGGSSTGGRSRYTSGSTANDITSNTGCTPLTVIYARGTVSSPRDPRSFSSTMLICASRVRVATSARPSAQVSSGP